MKFNTTFQGKAIYFHLDLANQTCSFSSVPAIILVYYKGVDYLP
jgi:hypothetical protein